MKDGMRKVALLLVAALALAALASPAAAGRKKPWEKFKYPPLGAIQEPAYERVELPSGMVLYLAEDHELPMVELSATIQVGKIYEPADKTGLAAITGEVMRTGGTDKWSGDEIDELTESMGMSVETSIGDATGSAYGFSLAEDVDRLLEIYAGVLMHPRFDQEKLDLAKTQHKSAIARRNDDPMQIARREFRRVMYGPDHPLGRIEEYDTINSITRDDLVAFHATYFHPDRMYLVVIGDFDRQAMIDKIQAAFAGWEKATTPLPPDPEIPDLPRTINVAPKEGLTQSTIIVGQKGIRNDNPNYAAIKVASKILGGGFSSRLFNEVRSKRGLAYSTGSSPGTGWRYPGVFVAFAGTKCETTEKATQVIMEQIQRMVTEPVTDEELQMAKDAILNSDVFNYDTKREILDRKVLFEMYGYPQDFLQKYREAVQALTPQQVLAACQAVWHPDRMSILVVGDPAKFDGDLSDFGPVNTIDITIPEPRLTLDVPPATDASLAAGQALLDRAAQAVGGKALARMRAYHRTMELNLTIQGMPMTFTVETLIKLPDHMKQVQKTPFGEMSQVLAGNQAWAKTPMGDKEITGDDLQSMRDQLAQELLVLLKDHADLTCQALDPVEQDGRTLDRVYITGIGDDYILLYLDHDTGLPAMEQSKGQNPMSGEPVVQKVVYGEWENHGGVKVPATLTILNDDEEFAKATLKEFALNPNVPADAFTR